VTIDGSNKGRIEGVGAWNGPANEEVRSQMQTDHIEWSDGGTAPAAAAPGQVAPAPVVDLALTPNALVIAAPRSGESATVELADAAADVATLDLKSCWSSLQSALRSRIRREQFETWFRRAELRSSTGGGLVLAVQNTFAADWLRTHYREALDLSIEEVLGRAAALEIVVDSELTVPARVRNVSGEASDPAAPGAEAQGAGTTQTAALQTQLASPVHVNPGSSRPSLDSARWNSAGPESGLMWSSDVTLNPNYRFDNFVVGPCNRFAYAAAVGVSESPGKSYNPFFLHGSVGLGKTHLLQSLCYSLLERTPGVRILYLSCETFINHFISALENGDLHKFRTKYRNVDLLVVDDIHLLANKERTQEEFFHTFNTLYNAGKQIVLSSDSPPKEIPTLQERLVSRFKWGLVTEIETPCYETRMAILKRKSKERGHELPDQVAQLLAEHIDSNIRELEGAVNRLISYAGLNRQEITTDLVRRLLRDIFTQPKGQPTMDDVLRVVTAHFQVKVTELQSRRRTKAIAFPRQVAMFLARSITRHSLEEVGGFFGGRDHTTVLYAVEQIDKQMRADERFRGTVQGLLAQLQR
jgi:chromosomal replication initiator protein